MEEVSNVAVLITHASKTASSSTLAALGPVSQSQAAVEDEASQQRRAADSLIQVIEKLSKIVEKRPQHQFTLAGQKRAILLVSSEAGGGETAQDTRGGASGSPYKKIKKNCEENDCAAVTLDTSLVDDALSYPVSEGINHLKIASLTTTEEANHPKSIGHKRTATCYQCSLCPYLSQTLPLLKEHLKQHNEQPTDLILMCSKCHFTSRDQIQLEAHVRQHLTTNDKKGSTLSDCEDTDGAPKKPEGSCAEIGARKGSDADASEELPQKKKWYSHEDYGLYRCLICSYVCSQQRMLKTHAWKHAGQVDCSYPIFEDEDGAQTGREAQAASNAPGCEEKMVILSPVVQGKSQQTLLPEVKLQPHEAPLAADKEDNIVAQPGSFPSDEGAEKDESVYDFKEEPMVEVQVKTEVESEVSGAVTHDSLLSSAQKIISSSPNSAGHINVIVERLPSAEDSVLTTNPLFLGPDEGLDKSLLYAEEAERRCVEAPEREVDPGGGGEGTVGTDIKSAAINSDSSSDENIPPAGRKRTHSESLRLHSLAAEALVTMPMRTLQVPPASTKLNVKNSTAQNQSVDQKQEEGATCGQDTSAGALLQLELHNKGREKEIRSLGLAEGDEEGPVTKAGISLSLLTVIERLRERSDQNASDEDILKELRDNAQFQTGAVAGVFAGNGSAGYVCNLPGMDGLVASSDGGLVDYIPGSDRPYRCRLCRYSSSNKGYIKQHLRVHRQRQPYQCPICEHIALDSKDLESHMIHHCKSRSYQCKLCQETFHHKSQLRSHEKEHDNLSSDTAALTATDGMTIIKEAEQEIADCVLQKLFKCDVCDYTSSTYVGVRNHRRIHNSEKPYRCCSCDFATTNMNSLKGHMRRHPQEHQAMQLLEQYRCSLCGYVCSHPPSLKSHMWKHAGDQNYNYEQVNKAINEAISQSSRAPQRSAGMDVVAECPPAVHPSKDKAKASAEAAVGVSVDGPGCVLPGATDPLEPGVSVQYPTLSQAPAPGAGMEYCVLLFCCCICGFESTSKEHLMEHMKDHEGDIISIILNKQQQQAEAPPRLQSAE
ncbi:zinc finger protein 507 [Takifugu flavidus]|uniref:Zinc finger protein 507 n=1 Tax=Takifugu flavidus TaxID=433684 RepID=A0A5C6NKD3_9TELE|nr:zinc finger protein 507 [Takifugu flavidus]XP_056881550.1 zinc finger protein 507 [Takifugu flavidus]XP_056881551.1 zinc finger protein 507 [Takifugu flavidus]TWW67099.1 Zinc finger protein 507 [Takifugu flavidus]